MINQPAGGSGYSVAKFPKEERVSLKIAVKANFIGSPPLEIVAQETHQFAADNFMFHTLPELFWTLKYKFGTVLWLYG